MKVLGSEDIENLLYGVTFLGTGGGGSMKKGMDLLHSDLKDGIVFYMIDLDEMSPDDPVASPYYVGAVGTSSESILSLDPAFEATGLLERHIGSTFKGIIAAELGGYATAGALHTAGLKKVPLIDADAAGRAAPDLQCSLFSVAKMPMTPFSVCTAEKDEMIMKSLGSDERGETIVRGIAAGLGSFVGICDHPTTAKGLGNSCSRNSISRAIAIGKGLREKNLNKVLEVGDLWVLFRGRLIDTNKETKEGYTFGNHTLEGVGDFQGKQMKIWYKNENLMSWLDGRVYVTTPDLISLTTTEFLPVTNPINEIGSEYIVFGGKSDNKWRTEDGLSVMSPRFFGYDHEYVPIEKVVE